MYLFTIILAGALFFLFYKAYRNTKNVTVNTVTIKDNKATGSRKTLSILHLSDFHLENLSISPGELYIAASKQPVDLIALTGDFLDRKRSIQKLIPYLNVFKKINPKYGIFAVFGNHDYVLNTKNFNRLKQTLEDNGCKALQNEHVAIDVQGTRLNIIGIDDYSTGRSNIAGSFHGIQNGYNLVLTHDPNVVLDMQDADFDYLLSGHFHGGQIHWPKPYHLIKMGRLVKMKMVKGLHYHDGKPFYISEGLGQTGVNIRIGSRPEITFHNIS